MKKPRLIDIFTSFFMISLCTFGGGYAMLPMLEREIVERRAWIDREQLLDLFAVAQGLPGIIGINTACLVVGKLYGYAEGDSTDKDATREPSAIIKILATIIAALAIMLPCIIIILIVAMVLTSFHENETVKHALAGVSICVLGLILKSVIKMWKSSIKCIPQAALFAGTFALCLLTNISPIFAILGGGILGAVSGLIAKLRVGRKS